MKALVYTAPNRLEYKNVPDPQVRAGEVLIKVKAVGICGSDVHGYTGSTGRRIPPLIMGHEVAGDVVSRGDGVEDFTVGERVSFDPVIFCAKCDFCRAGTPNLCENRIVIGVSAQAGSVDGGMAELVAVPAKAVFKIPESVSYEEASQLDGLAVAVHAVNRTTIRLNDTVAVVGAGPIGLLTLQAAKAAGAGRILATDLSDHRLRLAEKLGADLTANVTKEDPIALIEEVTDGVGADAVIEAVGLEASFQQAMALTKTGGYLTLIGNSQRMVEINMQDIVTRELNIRGTYGNGGEYRDCIDLIASGRIDVKSLISEVRPLSEGAAAFAQLAQGEGEAIKIVLRP